MASNLLFILENKSWGINPIPSKFQRAVVPGNPNLHAYPIWGEGGRSIDFAYNPLFVADACGSLKPSSFATGSGPTCQATWSYNWSIGSRIRLHILGLPGPQRIGISLEFGFTPPTLFSRIKSKFDAMKVFTTFIFAAKNVPNFYFSHQT